MPDSDRLRRRAVPALLALAASLGGCGGEPDDPSAEARAAAADYLAAAVELDGPAACALLTERGRDEIILAANRGGRGPELARCEDVFESIGTGGSFDAGAQAKLDRYIEGVRNGEDPTLELRLDGEDAATLESTNAGAFSIPLTLTDDGWRVEDGLDPLWDYGLDDPPPGRDR